MVADTKAKAKTEEKKDEQIAVVPGPRSFAVPGNDLTGYLGVSPEYMTYANPTDKPLMTEAEAWDYTHLTDEEIKAIQDRKPNKDLGVSEHEAPAIVPGTSHEDLGTGGASRYSEVEGVNVDSNGRYSHPLVYFDDEGDDGLTGEEKADIAQGVRTEAEVRESKKKKTDTKPPVKPAGSNNS